jgi:hypothetical protein
MKKFVSVFLILIGCEAFAWQASFIVQATAGAPIPDAPSASDAKSLVMSGLQNAIEVCIVNETGTRIEVNTINWNAPAPTTFTHYIPAGRELCIDDKLSSRVYISGFGGAITDDKYVHGFAR